jgi:hypothetical protein
MLVALGKYLHAHERDRRSRRQLATAEGDKRIELPRRRLRKAIIITEEKEVGTLATHVFSVGRHMLQHGSLFCSEILEKRRREEAAAKEHKEEEEMRRVAACREERERKRELVRRAKAAMEENPDAQNKGKWPRCTQ